MTTLGDAGRGRAALPRLHVVTDDEVLARETFLKTAARVLEAGGGRIALHVRGPATSGARLHAFAAALRPSADAVGSLLLVNDRVDVALAVGAHGVHLGRRSLPVAEVRRIVPPSVLVGVSTHDGGEVEAAARDGVDFAFVGTLYQTASHPGWPGRGVEAMAAVSRLARDLPLLAIGGVTVERTSAVVEAGAHGVAAIRGIWNERDPQAAVRRYLEVLESARGGAEGTRGRA